MTGSRHSADLPAGGPVFRRQTAIWLMAFGLFAFLAAIALRDAAPELESLRSTGADAFSHSAIGHGAFVETLERLGFAVDISRFRTARSSRPADLLVIAAPPDADSLSNILDSLDRYRQSAGNVLLVLPKWQGRRDRNQPRWLATIELVPEPRIVAILRRALQSTIGPRDGRIVRPGSTTWTDSSLGDLLPDIDQPQLLSYIGLQAVIGTPDGALIASMQRGGRTLWVLSDPDLIDNQGLGRGDNAALALRLIEAALPTGGRVIFDETIHGFERPPSLWRALLNPPFLPATLAGIVAIAAVGWAANRRFGTPLPAPQVKSGGKTGLIASSGDLLLRGGHRNAVLAAFAATLARDVERRLHIPSGLNDSDRTAWLRRLGIVRKATIDGPALLRQAADSDTGRPSEADMTRMARELLQWRREMTNGSGRRSDPV